MQRKKWKKHIPNIITMVNLLLGMLAIFVLIRSTHPGKELVSAAMILTGALLDALDGTIARKLNAVTDIGKQLDSFADLVTFGVAPICLVHHLEICQHSSAIALFAWVFPLAGAYRLARYNLNDFSTYFMGLPITAAGVILTLYSVAFLHWFPNVNASLLVTVTLLLVFALALMMVSRVKVRRISFSRFHKAKPAAKG